MKNSVIKFTNGFGQTEYWKEYGGWTRHISEAQTYEVDDAIRIVEGAKASGVAAPIWNTAKAVFIRITEA